MVEGAKLMRAELGQTDSEGDNACRDIEVIRLRAGNSNIWSSPLSSA